MNRNIGLKFNDQGLIPAIVQDNQTMEILMLAWMNADSLQRTMDTGETWFWSRGMNYGTKAPRQETYKKLFK